MRIELHADATLKMFARKIDVLSERALTTVQQGLQHGGDKMRTKVQRALKEQTSVAKYKSITAGTKGFVDKEALTYTIEAQGRGLSIEEFKYSKGSQSKKVQWRWSRTEHWRVQTRVEGRFGRIKDMADKGVAATMWGRTIAFKRSFQRKGESPRMQRVAGLIGTRELFGPSLALELVKDQSLSTFETEARDTVMADIERRLSKLLPKAS